MKFKVCVTVKESGKFFSYHVMLMLRFTCSSKVGKGMIASWPYPLSSWGASLAMGFSFVPCLSVYAPLVCLVFGERESPSGYEPIAVVVCFRVIRCLYIFYNLQPEVSKPHPRALFEWLTTDVCCVRGSSVGNIMGAGRGGGQLGVQLTSWSLGPVVWGTTALPLRPPPWYFYFAFCVADLVSIGPELVCWFVFSGLQLSR